MEVSNVKVRLPIPRLRATLFLADFPLVFLDMYQPYGQETLHIQEHQTYVIAAAIYSLQIHKAYQNFSETGAFFMASVDITNQARANAQFLKTRLHVHYMKLYLYTMENISVEVQKVALHHDWQPLSDESLGH